MNIANFWQSIFAFCNSVTIRKRRKKTAEVMLAFMGFYQNR